MSFASDEKETPTSSEKGADEAAACQSKPRDKGPPSAIRLIRDDFGLFKQDFLNIFKDKDAKNPEAKDKTPLNVLKEDLGLFKSEITSFTDDITGILRKGLFREDASRVKAQEQSERQGQEEEDPFTIKAQNDEGERGKEDPFTIKAQNDEGERDKEDPFTIKAQDDEGERDKEDPFTIKAQDDEGERDKEDPFTIKAQDDEGERDKEDPFTIKAQNDEGERDKEDPFTIKELNERSESAEVEDSFRIKASEQMEKSSDVEREDCFKLKAQGLNGGEGKDDRAFKLKAQGLNGEEGKDDRAFKLKAQGLNGGEGKDDRAFKLKARDGSRDLEKEETRDELGLDGWEVVELEQNENVADPKRTEPDGAGGGGGPGLAPDAPSPQEESELEPLISLSSGLLPLRNVDPERRVSLVNDVWTIKNFAQYLTFDPNTANSELVLSEGNRTARREWRNTTPEPPEQPEHPERFEHCPQLLCREGLLDAVYWEVQWSGGVDVGVAYNSLSRGGAVSEGLLGQNAASWSLECSRGSYTPCHRGRRFSSVSPEPFSQTVGLFLDFEAGSLSFFCVSPGSMQHLHTFRASFTEPLYPGFWLWSWGGSVTLSQVELGWERLLQ